MKIHEIRKGVIGLLIFIVFFIGIFNYTFLKAGTVASPENTDYEAYPPFSIAGSPPLVMLNISNDYKVFTEAYNDTIDLDGDGMIDLSYKNNIDYYGYFDPFKCYTYQSGVFVPTSVTSSNHYCSGTTQEWSGNFLNWLAMSRIDTIRKALYGGKRITDSSSTTILGGENIPTNALSWGKEYTGSDSRKLTPFDPPTGSISSVCTAPSTSVTWTSNINGIANPILQVKYTGGSSTTLPTNDAQILASYNVCGFSEYSYVATIDDPITNDDFPQRGNFYYVTEFQVTNSHIASGFPWKFNITSIGSNDVAAVYVNGTKVADYLGGTSNPGQINLTTAGWYRLVVIHRDNQGNNDNDGITLSYIAPTDYKYVCQNRTSTVCGGPSDTTTCGNKGPCVLATPMTQSSSYKVFGSDSALSLRAPYLGSNPNDSCRLKHSNFISTGEPQSGITVDCGGGGASKRHLFCITGSNTTSKIRALKDVPYRAWNWASVNGSQCGNIIDANNDGIAETNITPSDLDVKVEVCKSGLLEENCKKYGSNYKPIGLLQKHGEGDNNNKVCSKSGKPCTNDNNCNSTGEGVCITKSKMYFGLLTGARQNPKAGGVLRKNIWSVMNEVVDTTGILNTNTDNTNPGTGNVAVGHIVNAINNITWTNSSNMWGNPVAEMMYEATRYLMDKGQSTSAFSSGVTDSPVAGWLKPYQQIFPSCSKPFVITISDINPSYDSNQLPGSNFGSLTSDISDMNVSTLADIIGGEEGINGKNFVIGQFSTNFDNLCNSKGPINLSQVRGLCPEEPSKEGSYYSAAVAYYGHTKGSPQPIGYYSFVQPSKLPVFEISLNSKKISISPLAKNIDGNYFTDDQATTNCYNKCSGITTLRSDGSINLSGCSSSASCKNNQIADVYIENIEYDSNKNIIYASYRVGFDDAQELNDFDMDSIVKYEFITKAYIDKYNLSSTTPYSSYPLTSNQLLVHIKQEYASSGYATALGFTISGTTADNYYLPLRDDNTSPAPFNSMVTEWFKVFTVSSTGTQGFLKDPLWYAAKWGAFVDKNGNQKPDLQDEWDQDKNGIPDAYYLVANPLQLEQKLEEVFLDILKRTSSGTAVSVLASSAEGEGALYQAFFKPVLEGDYGPVKWTGFLQGLFVDPYGNIREDTDKDNRLNLIVDRIIKFRLDDVTKDTVADLYIDSNGDGIPDGTAVATVPLTDIKSLWEAGKELAKMSDSDRILFTSTNGTESGRVNFTESNVATLKNYLGPLVFNDADSNTLAGKVINFIRGKHVEGLRNRYLTVDGMQRVWKLGDIVYSTPTIVSAPSENYDLIYGDKSYFNFYKKYKNRIAVVYAGSNDGVLHAFYSGTYHQGDDSSTVNGESGWFEDTLGIGLGKELWGFIPKSFLPHLYWQTQDDYRHVFGVDLKPKIVDLKIFTPDSTHIDGWGTVLIGGMRLGGGEIKASDSGSQTIYPSYFAIDITDPINPKLLWEFSHPDLGMTLSYPTVAKVGDKWFAVFGSGPMGRDPSSGSTTSYKDTAGYYGVSTKTGKIFVVDIKAGGATWTLNSNYWILDTGLTNAIMGSPVTLDVNLDFNSDVIYIGAANGTSFTSQGGAFYRIITNNVNPAMWKITKMFTTASNMRPLLSAPAVSFRPDGTLWVYLSSGRFLHKDDAVTTNQEKFYGFKDPCYIGAFISTCSDSNLFTEANLADVSNVVVNIDGNVEGASALTGKTVSKFDELKQSILQSSYRGWMANMIESKERGVAKPALIGDVVLYTTFTPTGDVCGGGGHGNIYALYSLTGTAYIKPIIGTTGTVINKKLSLSSGTPSSISIHMGREKGGKAYVQQSTGEILTVEFQTAARAKSGYILWREKW